MVQKKLENSFLFLVPVSCIAGNSHALKDGGDQKDWGALDSSPLQIRSVFVIHLIPLAFEIPQLKHFFFLKTSLFLFL